VWTRDGKGTFMYANNGNGKFGNPVEIDVKDNCLARGENSDQQLAMCFSASCSNGSIRCTLGRPE
jgi:hypothetical protein